MKLRTRLRALFIIILLIWAYPSINSLIIGGILIIIGQIIHFISAGYLVKQEQLITAGPYRYVRNPFYVGSFLVDVGLCIVTQNIYVAIVYLPIFYLIVITRRVRKEEEFLKQQFGDKYIEYCRLVPRFIPRLLVRLERKQISRTYPEHSEGLPAKLPEINGYFEWELIWKYREQWRLVRILGLIIFFYLRLIIIPVNWNKENIIRNLSEPLNTIFGLILLVILCLPPIYEFIIKPLWKMIRK